MSRRDPRTLLKYQQMIGIIDLLEIEGPQTIGDICSDQMISRQQFKNCRYSLAGQLAMEDRGVVIPRPVTSEKYIYKLASAYRTGNVDDDGEPNLQSATSDLLTRVATIYMDVEKLIEFVPGRSAIRRLLRKLQKSLDGTLDRAEDVATDVGAPISLRAEHVLDRIA
jgi:hypothetical protein